MSLKEKETRKESVKKLVARTSDPLVAARGLAEATNSDRHHMAQVTHVALMLFDRLVSLHKLGTRERLLLEISAMLHDIGWSRTTNGGHHKHGRDMILEAKLPGLKKDELMLCAQVARYHNKSEPDESRHKAFAALNKKDRTRVCWLAGMLRVADGLDCTHRCSIRITGCDIGKKQVTIHLSSRRDPATEISGAKKKSHLLMKMVDRELDFRP